MLYTGSFSHFSFDLCSCKLTLSATAASTHQPLPLLLLLLLLRRQALTSRHCCCCRKNSPAFAAATAASPHQPFRMLDSSDADTQYRPQQLRALTSRCLRSAYNAMRQYIVQKDRHAQRLLLMLLLLMPFCAAAITHYLQPL
jgi:hypothetical protein